MFPIVHSNVIHNKISHQVNVHNNFAGIGRMSMLLA
jgi:hypothetical protein